MSKLSWGTAGDRFYEAGADRGVLYASGEVGVAWNGLISVSEAPSGGEPNPHYIDGFKYVNLAAAEEFVATIEAFSSPNEFAKCDGTAQIHAGLFITQQPRKIFGLCYRTMVGNDLDGLGYGYKLHLVYNALASPSSRDNQTLSDSANPIILSWGITTNPPPLADNKPTAHLLIDSRYTPEGLMLYLEDILYGSDTSEPYMSSPQEFVDLFASWPNP